MKKLMLLLSFFTFTAIVSVSAQCSKSAAACCSKKSSTSASTTTTGADAMVIKVGNTSETKAACCSKGDAKSCSKKEASSCHGATSGKVSEVSPATAPKAEVRVVKNTEAAVAAPVANEDDK